MKVAVIGVGQLGGSLLKVLGGEGVGVYHGMCPPRSCDVHYLDTVRQALQVIQPDWVINTAAFHKVDECEAVSGSAFCTNALGAYNVASVAKELGIGVVYISTDYVFGHNGPWSESAKPQPLSVYGISKLAGEHLTMAYAPKWLIVRTSTLFGGPNSFVETMLRLAKEHDTLTITDDLTISPSYAPDVARKIIQLLELDRDIEVGVWLWHGRRGICHITNSGYCTHKEFAEEIFGQGGLSVEVLSGKAADRDIAVRPYNSVLEHGFLSWYSIDDMRSWQDALSEYLMEVSNA